MTDSFCIDNSACDVHTFYDPEHRTFVCGADHKCQPIQSPTPIQPTPIQPNQDIKIKDSKSKRGLIIVGGLVLICLIIVIMRKKT